MAIELEIQIPTLNFQNEGRPAPGEGIFQLLEYEKKERKKYSELINEKLTNEFYHSEVTLDRKFWRQYLPRLKYHNPNVEMEVDRNQKIGGPCELLVQFSDNRIETIPCNDKFPTDICKALLELTNAKQLPVLTKDAELAADYEAYLKERKAKEVRIQNKRRAKKEEEERQRLGVVA